jgi:hypothetical protein
MATTAEPTQLHTGSAKPSTKATNIHKTARSFIEASLESQLEPIGARYDGTGQDEEDDEEDDAASAPRTGGAPPKPESVLQPIEQPIEEEQLQQAGKTTRSIVHFSPLCVGSIEETGFFSMPMG